MASELIYQSSKTYTHAVGFSCAFRQWRAPSHCNQIHGYAIEVVLVFEGELDERNWVQDFGGLKEVKKLLEGTFDHTLIVAEDDPQKALFYALERAGAATVVTLPAVGCERFAEHVFHMIVDHYPKIGDKLVSVEIREHAGNAAKVIRK